MRSPGTCRDQLRRAARSVSNNIAEGFARGRTAGWFAFLYIARGSAGEVRSMLHFAGGLPEAAPLKSESSHLRSLAESCSRQIRAWADHLQNSEIKGPRHLNGRSRARFEGRKTAHAFGQELAHRLHHALPGIYPAPEAPP